MNVSRVTRLVAAIGIMTLAPVGGVALAQTTTSVPCAIAVGPLTTRQQSAVNDYEVQVAKANSKHTAVPDMPDAVFLLIGCTSPSAQTSTAAADVGTSTSTSTSTSPTTPTPTPTPAPTGQSGASFVCPPGGLNKSQLSMINDYEVLLARANSKHTQAPVLPDDVAAFLACQ